jgi:hypothetical protein
VGPDKNTDQDGIDVRRLGSIIDHQSHLYPCSLQPRGDGQDCQMPFSITFASLSKLLSIGLGTQPQGNAHLIECQIGPVGVDLDFRHHSEEKRAQVLRIEILPAGGKPRSLVKKRLLGNNVGATTLNCVQDGNRVSEPCADPASNQSLDMSGRNALPPVGRLVADQQRFGDVVSIPDTLLYRMTRRHRFAMRVVEETSEQA